MGYTRSRWIHLVAKHACREGTSLHASRHPNRYARRNKWLLRVMTLDMLQKGEKS